MADCLIIAAKMGTIKDNILLDNTTLYTHIMRKGSFNYLCTMNVICLITFAAYSMFFRNSATNYLPSLHAADNTLFNY